MLRFLKSLFPSPCPRSASFAWHIAFWTTEELSDLSPRLAKLFGLESFDRDYENAWEWLEATTPDGLRVNVSRTHNWKTGDYHLPVVIHITRNGYVSSEEIDRWASLLSECLNTDVSVGNLINSKSAEYSFHCDRQFPKPKKG